MTVRTLPDGRVSLDAPPEAASTLATMLRALAAMLDVRSGPPA